MQFKVPQFLDIEDKIFGPFTFSQFIYLVGGAGLCYLIFKILGLLLGFIPIILVAGFSLALAFYRPNNKSFLSLVQAIITYYSQNRLYIWKQKEKKDLFEKKEKENLIIKNLNRENLRLNKSKLRDLAWGLDVLDIKKDN